MPFTHLALIIFAVLGAAAVTIWLLSLGGGGLMVAALPAFLLAALAIKVLRR